MMRENFEIFGRDGGVEMNVIGGPHRQRGEENQKSREM